MKTVLITGIGGDIAQSVATIVKESFPDWQIIGSDIHEQHAGRLFADDFVIAPRADDAEFINWLSGTMSDRDIDLCIPLSEAELSRLGRLPGDQVDMSKMVIAGAQALAVGADKLSTQKFLQQTGIPGPWTLESLTELTEGHLPCIIKPNVGSGSKGVHICNTLDEARALAGIVPAPVFQELLLPHDREITCAVFRSSAGETTVLPLLRILTGGFTGWAKVIENDQITEQCQLIANELDILGSINIQLRLTSEGPRIFEINPRFSSTSLIRHRLGFEDVVWSIKDRLGLPFDVHLPKEGAIGVRVQSAARLN